MLDDPIAKVLDDLGIVKWGNHELKVLETPGHSRDCLVFIVDKIKSVFTGDTIFNGSIGRTDLPGGDHNQIIQSIQKLFKYTQDDYLLYPGHGPRTMVDNEKKYNPFLK